MTEETKDLKELIVIKDGRVDAIPVIARTARTYKTGLSDKTNTRYRSVVYLRDINVMQGRGQDAYIIGDDLDVCITKYNEYISSQVEISKKSVAYLQSLIVEGNHNG